MGKALKGHIPHENGVPINKMPHKVGCVCWRCCGNKNNFFFRTKEEYEINPLEDISF